MKLFFRYFFRTIRLVLGPILLFIEWISTPRGIQRSVEDQQQVDEATSKLALYQFKTCPFCIKARRAIKRLSLNIELRDAQKNQKNREELAQYGGEIKVPCLKILDDDGNATWLYESEEIIKYLETHYS